MTAIVKANPVFAHNIRLHLLGLPKFAPGDSIEAIVRLMGTALSMAYVQPYASWNAHNLKQWDEDLEGRDPNW